MKWVKTSWIYSMTKKSWHNSYSNLLYKIQYIYFILFYMATYFIKWIKTSLVYSAAATDRDLIGQRPHPTENLLSRHISVEFQSVETSVRWNSTRDKWYISNFSLNSTQNDFLVILIIGYTNSDLTCDLLYCMSKKKSWFEIEIVRKPQKYCIVTLSNKCCKKGPIKKKNPGWKAQSLYNVSTTYYY